MKRKLVSVFFLMTLCSTSARAALTNEEMDCLFNWAERSYAQLFSPAAAPSQTLAPYYFRYYAGTRTYLGVNKSNQHVVYLAPSMGAPADLGDAAPFATTAGCTAATVPPPSSANYAGTWTWSYGTGSAFSVQFVVTAFYPPDCPPLPSSLTTVIKIAAQSKPTDHALPFSPAHS